MKTLTKILIGLGVIGLIAGVLYSLQPQQEAGAYPSRQGLVLELNMDDNAGTTDVSDTSDENNTCTAQQNTSVLSEVSLHQRALTFNGSSDYVDCGNDPSLDIAAAVAVEVWAKWQDSVYGYILNMLTDKPDSSTSKINLAVAGTGNGIGADVGEVYIYDGGAVITLTGIILTENEWTHLVFSRTGTGANQAHIYKNGVLSWTGTWTNTGSNPYILFGTMKVAVQNLFLGSISSVKIYNRALDADEIAHSYFMGSATRLKNCVLKNVTIH